VCIQYSTQRSWKNGEIYCCEERAYEEPYCAEHRYCRDDVGYQPEDQFQTKAEDTIEQEHSTFSKTMRWLYQNEAAQAQATVEAGGDVTHFSHVTVANSHQVFDNPTYETWN
jgi:hypothetical protein